MRLMFHFASLILLTLGLVSCSGKPAGSRDLEVSSNFLVSKDFVGGAIVRVQNPATSAFTDYDLTTPPFVVAIPDGVWNIYVVGIDSEQTAFCGSSLSLSLGADTTSINISANVASCSNTPFPALIGKRIATWDYSNWDKVNWGP